MGHRLSAAVVLTVVTFGILASVPLASVARASEDPAHATDSESHDTSGHKAEAKPPTTMDPDLAIWTAVVFLALLAVLWKFAWGPIMQALDAREQAITGAIDDAANMRDEAKELLAAHEAKLATAKDEVREMLEEARRDAEVTKKTIVDEAHAAAVDHQARAVRDIEQARDAAVRTLAEQSANLAVDLAGKVVKQNMTADRQAELVSEAMNRLAGSSPSDN